MKMKMKEEQIQQMTMDESWREEKPFVGNGDDEGNDVVAVAAVVLFALPTRGKGVQTWARRETKAKASTKAIQTEGKKDTWERWIEECESRWKKRKDDEGDEEDDERATSQQEHHQDRGQDSSSTQLEPGPGLVVQP